MRRLGTMVAVLSWLVLAFSGLTPALAQTPTPPATEPPLTIFTAYPDQVMGMSETVNVDLKLHATNQPQVVALSLEKVPDGWTATFRGGGRIVNSVYVQPDIIQNNSVQNNDAAVTLRLEPPKDVKAGTYPFVVVGKSGAETIRLPLNMTVQEKAPSKLSWQIDLPSTSGGPNSTFTFNPTLKNDGDQDLAVNLTADAPQNLKVSFKLSANDVTSVPLDANQQRVLSVQAQAIGDIAAGTYPIAVHATSADVVATLDLTVLVTGEPTLSVTAPDGRLSGQSSAGQKTPLKVQISNTGSAPAQNIQLTSNAPSGWNVEFDPKTVAQLPPGQQTQVTANIQPPDKALAGDYVVTVNAQPQDNPTKSADFRITVSTSTLWGVVGVGLIAVAVIVVALAVLQFGRR
jgi:uncharacterized membrane protein